MQTGTVAEMQTRMCVDAEWWFSLFRGDRMLYSDCAAVSTKACII